MFHFSIPFLLLFFLLFCVAQKLLNINLNPNKTFRQQMRESEKFLSQKVAIR